MEFNWQQGDEKQRTLDLRLIYDEDDGSMTIDHEGQTETYADESAATTAFQSALQAAKAGSSD